MNWKDHLKWGLVSVSITLIAIFAIEYFDIYHFPWVIDLPFLQTYYPTWEYWILAFLIGLYGSIIPDIDIGTSKAFHLTFTMLILLILYYLLFTTAIIPIVVILMLMIIIMNLKHRGMMHSFWVMWILSFFFMWMFGCALVAIVFLIGFGTHLLCDNV